MGQSAQQRAVRLTELLLHEFGPGLTFSPIRNGHAARVIHQDAQEVLLRHRRLEDDRRTEQTEEEQGDDAQTQADEQRPIPNAAVGDDAPVGNQGRQRQETDDRQPGNRHSSGGEGELALLEDEHRILEQELEQPSHGNAHPRSFYRSRDTHGHFSTVWRRRPP